jgi:hypothetical protein
MVSWDPAELSYPSIQLIAAAVYYGSPAWARKRAIWPPLAKDSDPVSGHAHADVAMVSVSDQLARAWEEGAQDPTPAVRINDAQTPTQGLFEELQALSMRRDALYQPLHDGETIRILELHPGTLNDPLRCDFHYANLRQLHMCYEALSYVWGDPNKQEYDYLTGVRSKIITTIHCNNHIKQINPNLDIALRHIREQSKSVHLWVDALCINQEDDRERGHQVTLMGSVYRNAQRVVIWIGEKSDVHLWDDVTYKTLNPPTEFEDVRAQRSFGAICDIVNRWQGTDDKTRQASYTLRTQTTLKGDDKYCAFEMTPSSVTRSRDQDLMRKALEYHYQTRTERKKNRWRSGGMHDEDELPHPDSGIGSSPQAAADSHFWMSVADLFDRSWFWRVWVVQEAVLAKEAVVRWANTEIDWRWVGLASAILRTNHRDICESMHIGGVYNAYLMYRISGLSDLPAPELSFVELLRLTRQFDVTDPRDRVYGLLGMKTTDNDPGAGAMFLEPDYTITQNELWKRLAWKSIQLTGKLSILSSVQYSIGSFESEHALGKRNFDWLDDVNKSKDLIPSWIPHWQIVYRTTLTPWDASESFAAARGLPLQLKEYDDSVPKVLEVEGIQVGTVGYEGVFMWHDVDTSFLVSKQLGSFFASRSGLQLLSRTFSAGRDAYGSLTESTERVLSDFAAYVLTLHEHWSSSNPNRHDSEEDYERDEMSDFDHLGLLNNTSYERREQKSFGVIFKRHPDLKSNLQRWAKNGDYNRFCESAVAICERRRLFLTLNGFLGLGPDPVKEGDIVAVLAGGDVPFLLRPLAMTNNPVLREDIDDTMIKRSEYLLVGECYVEGLMKGEAVCAVDDKSELIGPVPIEYLLQEIIAHGNEPEDVPGFAPIGEIERTKRKKARLDQGDFFSIETLRNHVHIQAKKRTFDIL